MGLCCHTFLPSLVITVLEGAGPPGTPRRHLTVDGTGDLAQLGPVGDRTLAQLVFHRAGGCADKQKGTQNKQQIKLTCFTLILFWFVFMLFFTYLHCNQQKQGTQKCLFTFIPGIRFSMDSR